MLARSTRFESCEHKFSLQVLLPEEGPDLSPDASGRLTRIEKQQNRWASAAQDSTDDPVLARERTQRLQERAESTAIGLVNAILERFAQ